MCVRACVCVDRSSPSWSRVPGIGSSPFTESVFSLSLILSRSLGPDSPPLHWPQDSRDEARGERSIRGAVKPTERERTRKCRASRKARTRGRAREKEREAGISRRLDRDENSKERGRAANRERERRQRRVAVRGGDYRAVNHPRWTFNSRIAIRQVCFGPRESVTRASVRRSKRAFRETREEVDQSLPLHVALIRSVSFRSRQSHRFLVHPFVRRLDRAALLLTFLFRATRDTHSRICDATVPNQTNIITRVIVPTRAERDLSSRSLSTNRRYLPYNQRTRPFGPVSQHETSGCNTRSRPERSLSWATRNERGLPFRKPLSSFVESSDQPLQGKWSFILFLEECAPLVSRNRAISRRDR